MTRARWKRAYPAFRPSRELLTEGTLEACVPSDRACAEDIKEGRTGTSTEHMSHCYFKGLSI